MFKPLIPALAPALAMSALMVLAGSAVAHTPYLVPSNFAPGKAFVTVEAGISDSNFFASEMPIQGDGFTVTDDKGVSTEGKGVILTEVSLFETALPHDGTFRISTGTRLTREMTMTQVDGQWRPVRGPGGPGGGRGPGGQGAPGATPPAPPPVAPTAPSGPTLTVKMMTRADSYVSYNKPSDTLPPAEGKGLEIIPVSHPSRLFAGGSFDFAVLFDGQPATGLTWKAVRGGDIYEDQSFNADGDTGADGKASLPFAKPGVYLVSVSRKWDGVSTDNPTSWAATLTIEVAP